MYANVLELSNTIMVLWSSWWNILSLLRPAFSRSRTFFWFLLVSAAFSLRQDLFGVTSFVRALGLSPSCYDSLLNFFHSSSVKIDLLSQLWFKVVLTHFPVYHLDDRPVLILDGIKYAKEGRKMPGVKFLHQQSESNSKPHFIMGHSFQAFGVLCQVAGYYFCVPVCARIHEGIVRSNRDKRTLIDKAIQMLESVHQGQQFILIADAYYANRKMIGGLRAGSSELITRVRRNAVAYENAPEVKKRRRGRPKKYGQKVLLNNLFNSAGFQTILSPVYGESNIEIRYMTRDLLWKPAGEVVRFVLVDHPVRGRIILLSTDLTLTGEELILLYSLRFKIEMAFKQAVHTVGSFGYHFWMAEMKPIKRNSGNQHLHREPEKYRQQIERKLKAYHVFVQTGMIAQGMLQYLSMTKGEFVWKHFGSWIRTIRPDVLPSEMVVSAALRNTFSDFLHQGDIAEPFRKFVIKRIDFKRPEGSRFAA